MHKLGEFFFLISTIIYLPLHNVINKSDCTNLIDNMKIKDLYSGGMEKDNHYKGSVYVILSDILLRESMPDSQRHQLNFLPSKTGKIS